MALKRETESHVEHVELPPLLRPDAEHADLVRRAEAVAARLDEHVGSAQVNPLWPLGARALAQAVRGLERMRAYTFAAPEAERALLILAGVVLRAEALVQEAAPTLGADAPPDAP